MIGVYRIKNLINNKSYIGQSIHIEKRWKEHTLPSSHSLISKAIRKYGKENFSFQILEECNVKELDDLEIEYIQKYNSIIPYGYNIEFGGNGSNFQCYDMEQLLEIISDIQKTSLSFEKIAEKYNLSKRTIYRINNGEVHKNTNVKYPIRPYLEKTPKNYCKICNQIISKNSQYCIACYKIVIRKNFPQREILKEKIRYFSFTDIGKEYGVSDNTVKRWCKFYNLPFLKKDIKLINNDDWLLI